MTNLLVVSPISIFDDEGLRAYTIDIGRVIQGEKCKFNIGDFRVTMLGVSFVVFKGEVVVC